MTENIEIKQKLIAYYRRSGYVKDENAFDAFMAVPREMFVPEAQASCAYRDHPLPLMNTGQTISAPHMTIMILDYLELEAGQKILEIGAGSGYQAALIAAIVAPDEGNPGHVYSIEIVPELVEFAKKNLERAGFSRSVTVIEGDGTLGYKEQAPYDRIILTAAGPILPPPLIEQLKVGGSLVMPLGRPGLWQRMTRFRKVNQNATKKEKLSSVAFVPLRGKYGV
ncbi:MAG: protein-L-isoaspartate(D-aspartate) O-methyltransferase [Candidatus Hermodarchaeota archaeon]